MSTYDGFEIFKNRHQPQPQEENGEGGEVVNKNRDQLLNPKLKQCFEVKTKIEPFYSGGKFSVMSPTLFLTKCGSAIKLISTAVAVVKTEDENDDKQDKMEQEEEEEAKPANTQGFGVIGSFETELDEIISFDACPTANTLVTAHKSQLIRLWDIKTKEVTRTIKSFHSTPISTLEIHRARSLLEFEHCEDEKLEDHTEHLRGILSWATLAGNVVKLWDSGGSAVSKDLRIEGVPSIGYAKWDYTKEHSLKSPRLFVAERNIYLIAMDEVTRQFQVTKNLEGHYSQVTGIEWQENLMISCGRDKTIILWDTTNNNFTRTKTLAFPGEIESMILLSGKDLYLAASPALIKHLDLGTHALSAKPILPWSEEEAIIGFHPSPNNQEFFITTYTSCIYQVGRRNAKKNDKELQIKKQFVGTLDEILALALWGEEIAVATNTSVIKVYDLTAGDCKFLRGHTDIVLTLTVHKEFLISGSKDNRIILWVLDSCEPHAILDGHLGSVTSICTHPLELKIYSVSADNFIKVWDKEKCLNSAIAHEKEIHAIDCSPKGLLLATASRDRTVKLWDPKTLKTKAVLKGHKKSIWDVKFSAWDQLLVTASADSTLKIWNVLSYECMQTLQGHTSSVLQARFCNSGLQILSSSSDGTWKSWDIRTSLCLSTFETSNDKIWALESTPDGSTVITGTADSVVTIWKDITQEKVKEASDKRKKLVEDDQRLNNFLRKEDWKQAIAVAIELDKPFVLLKVIRSMGSEIETTLKELPKDLKMGLMGYAKKWNTNTRTCAEAQLVFNIILLTTPLEELDFVDTTAMLPYTKKHFDRLQKMKQYAVLANFFANR